MNLRDGAMRNTTVKIAPLFLALVSLSGCGSNERTAQKPEMVQGLHLQKVQMQATSDELEAPGTVVSANTAQVAARTMGTVLQVPVREGDLVKRGQLLAQLDDRELAAHRNAAQAATQRATAGVMQASKAVAAAQVQAEVTQKTYDRYSQLKAQNSVSPQEFDEISARQQAAQASLEQAKAGLREAEAGSHQSEAEAHAAQDVASYARITAPFDGRVVRRMVEPGSLVSPGISLFVVEDVSRDQLQASLPAEALALVKKNSLARVHLDAYPDKSFSGKVSEIEAGADPTSHTFNVRIDLPKDEAIRSGQFGRAFFARGEKQALLVPKAAVVNHGQLTGVFVVDDAGLIHWRVITLGKPAGDNVEVLSGLNSGAAIVLNPGLQELDGKQTSTTAVSGEKHS